MSPTYILWYLIIGLIAGWVAGRIIRGRGLGLTGNLVIGLTGALVGGYLFNALKLAKGVGTPGAILAATLGSGIALGIMGWLKSLVPEG
jgi:uncharacterized membrane protein YeaQ/YmgE (transglycosylase-associated protein family)